MDEQWTVQMLAGELLATRKALDTHVQGCETGQLKMLNDISDVKNVVTGVKSVVEGYEKFLSWTWVAAGKLILVIGAPITVAVVILAYQNANLHRDTAGKVGVAAQVLAKTTALQTEKSDIDQEERDKAIIALLQEIRKEEQHSRRN